MFHNTQQEKDLELRTNFLSVDKKIAMNSYGEFFKIGDTVSHEDTSMGYAVINSFEVDEPMNEVKIITDKGWAHIDFITKK